MTGLDLEGRRDTSPIKVPPSPPRPSLPARLSIMMQSVGEVRFTCMEALALKRPQSSASAILETIRRPSEGAVSSSMCLDGISNARFEDTKFVKNGTVARGTNGASPGGGLSTDRSGRRRLNIVFDRCLLSENFNDPDAPGVPGSRSNGNAYGGAIFMKAGRNNANDPVSSTFLVTLQNRSYRRTRVLLVVAFTTTGVAYSLRT